MIEVNALLKALIDKMALWSWDTPQESMNNTTTLFWEEFYAAQRQTFHLPLPTNRRFKVFRKQLMQATFFAPDLVSLANSVGASSKTVTRLFKAETGMSYQEWKQQWRLLKAIELLSKETPVNQVSDWLGFSSDSAFIAFFKKQTGQTPLSFIK